MRLNEILLEYELHSKKASNDPKFKSWFGDSKAVDDQGRPLVLFHGTAYDFDAFNVPLIWASEDPHLASLYAEQRPKWDKIIDEMGANVMPVFIKVEQPFNADALDEVVTIDTFLRGLVDQALSNGVDVHSHKDYIFEAFKAIEIGRKTEESGPHYNSWDFWYKPEELFGISAAKYLQRLFFLLEFDGIFYSEIHPEVQDKDVPTWGTFYGKNVKSAIGNVGSYDHSPELTESK